MLRFLVSGILLPGTFDALLVLFSMRGVAFDEGFRKVGVFSLKVDEEKALNSFGAACSRD